MPINVICPSCHTRFKVSEKFAGKTGACKKCKKPITVPELDEQVQIHERQHEGVKDSKGQLVLKPIERKETSVSSLIWVIAGCGSLVVLLMALVGRGLADGSRVQTGFLAAGALALAPLMSLLGYSFLRDDELDPYRGMALWIRIGICSLVYAALWGAYGLIPVGARSFTVSVEGDGEMWMAMVVLAPFLFGGSITSLATLDLDFGNAFFHYSLYVIVCVLLRMVMGLPAL